MTFVRVVPEHLRSLAEAVRPLTWWLWDEPAQEYGPVLAFAHACSPETVLALLDELEALRAREGAP